MTWSLTHQVEPVDHRRTQRLDDHDADFTPQGAALICAYAVRDLLCGNARPTSLYDPTAGGGVFGWAARKAMPWLHTVGNDIREEEREGLEANYDQDFGVDFGDLHKVTGRCDVGLTNVPFSIAGEVWESSEHMLTDGGWFAMMVRLTLGDDAEVCRKLWGSQVERRGRKGFFYLDNEDRYAELRRPDVVIEFSNRFRFREGTNPETGKRWGSDSTTYRLLCRQQGGPPRPRLAPTPFYKLDRMDDRLFSWAEASDGSRIRPGDEWRAEDPGAEAAIVDLAERSWAAMIDPDHIPVS